MFKRLVGPHSHSIIYTFYRSISIKFSTRHHFTDRFHNALPFLAMSIMSLLLWPFFYGGTKKWLRKKWLRSRFGSTGSSTGRWVDYGDRLPEQTPTDRPPLI